MARKIFEKFSNHYEKSLRVAASLALEFNHPIIEPEHLLYGLLSQKGSVGAELFNDSKNKAEEIKNYILKNRIESSLVGNIKNQELPIFSKSTKTIIQKSTHIAYLNKHKYIGTEHLLAALIQSNHQSIKSILTKLNISSSEITQKIISVLKSTSKLPEITETFKVTKDESRKNPFRQANMLELFGNNLTNQSTQKTIDPVIGREAELSRIIQILSRRTKNNPIVLGDPGVGKTALVEGLAKKILLGEVPDVLKNKKIFSLNLASAIAGTMYRGEFENRIKQLLEEVKANKNIIVFIDEIHNIIGAGSASGSMDAANILKPALARGEIRCIGATTYEDYRKTIENDPALARRFQAIRVPEPSESQAKNIIFGIKNYFERFHSVEISDLAIEAAVSLSQKYLTEKFLPDKAIDLIDEACSNIRINKKPNTYDLKVKSLRDQIKQLKKNKEYHILAEDYEKAIIAKKELEQATEKLVNLKKQQNKSKKRYIGKITDKDIAEVIEKMTGIPVKNLLASEKKQIIQLEKKLNQKIIGQKAAIKSITNQIKRAKAGLTDDDKPLASFMFVGPSGTGKTYTAKIIAEQLFKNQDSLIRIDMSEYSEKFNASKLIGAPAGYVGYKESGQLTEKVKHRPHSIILFDEIEKANPEIFDLFLQILDNGYLTDASGTQINFRHSIIIMTSNIGSHFFSQQKNIGFRQVNKKLDNLESYHIETQILDEVKKIFKVEFLNRLDKIIYFEPLTSQALEKIIKLELEKLSQKLKRKKINLLIDKSIVKFIKNKNLNREQGARSIAKTIQEFIETEISEAILTDNIASGQNISITADHNHKLEIKKDLE